MSLALLVGMPVVRCTQSKVAVGQVRTLVRLRALYGTRHCLYLSESSPVNYQSMSSLAEQQLDGGLRSLKAQGHISVHACPE